MPRLIDISQPLAPDTAVWPGDRPIGVSWTMLREEGASVNVAAFVATVHAGTHVDGPRHFYDDGDGPADLPLDAFIGPAVVIDAIGRDALDESVLPAIMAALDRDETLATDARPAMHARPDGGAEGPVGLARLRDLRLLFRTRARVDARTFPPRFAAFEPAFASRLAEAGVRLVGTDAPSVDPFDSKTLDAHRAFADGRVAILENIVLDDVPPGRYLLLAPPLKIVPADSAPCRAVLVEGDLRVGGFRGRAGVGN